MKKKVIPLFLSILSVAALTSCADLTPSDSASNSDSASASHVHTYDLTKPVWNWTGYTKATVTFTCSSCESTIEGHSKVVDATIKVKEKTDATCTEAGKTVYEATATFESKTFTDTKTLEKEATGHDKDETTWKSDATKHWHPCSNEGCDAHLDEAEHTFGDWKTVKESDHYNEGEKQRTCSVCEYVASESIAKTKFSYSEVLEIANKLSAYTSDDALPYACSTVNDLSYAIENLDTSSTGYDADKIAELKTYISEYNKKFTIGIDSKALNGGYTNAKVSREEDFKNFGNVLKINAPDDYAEENWTNGIDIKPSLVKAVADGAVNFKFAIYSSLTTDDGKNGLFDAAIRIGEKWYDNTSKTASETKVATTIGMEQTVVFEIPASVINDFESIKIDLYMGGTGVPYGIPSLTETSGSVYLTEVIGYKQNYYDEFYGATKTEIETAIKALPAEADLTQWSGGEILALKEKYDALPYFVQEEVEGSSTLLSLVDAYNAKYCIGLSVKDMDYSKYLDGEVTIDKKYGRVLKMNTKASETGEGFAFGSDIKASLDKAVKDGASSFTFSYYAPRPQAFGIVNGDCNTWYDFNTKAAVKSTAQVTTTLNVGWFTVTLPASVVAEFDSMHIATYYMGDESEGHGYGIPHASLNQGSAYITDIVGIKTTAADIMPKIDALDAKYGNKALSIWNGGEIATVREAYDSLNETEKGKVTNLDKLTALETAYKQVGTCYNTAYETGTLFATTFDSQIVIDEEKGLCTQFDGITAANFTFKPTTSMSLASGVSKVKVAIYNPTDGEVNAYILDKDWGSDGARTPITDTVEAKSWKEFEIDAKYCLNGVVNTLEVGFANAPTTGSSGWKITPLYSEAVAA